MADSSVHFCVDDTVGLVTDKTMVGICDRTFGDITSHDPRPQRDYDEYIECHRQIPKDQFQRFMRDGIPPRGTVLVSWQHVPRVELVPESCLELLDRALYVGDYVKRSAKDAMSGAVIGTMATCTLLPAVKFNAGNIAPGQAVQFAIPNVPSHALLNVHECNEGAIVVYKNWVGRVEDVHDEITVKLSNNTVVVVEHGDELVPDDPVIDRLSVGDTVSTKKGNLRRGRWKYGSFSPSIPPKGVVVETRTIKAVVQWLAPRLAANMTLSAPEPSSVLERDELESSEFRIYDASCAAPETLPRSENGVDLSYHVAEVAVGDRVRFKDLAGATSEHSEKLVKIPRTETLGYDMNVYIVLQTETTVTVRWQDLSITQEPGRSLIPDHSVSDNDEVWPGEIVCSKEERQNKVDDWALEPARVGVVQKVQSRDRIATVRWFENPSVRFLGPDLMPGSKTGVLGEQTEDVSLYDIRSMPTITRQRGDFVIIHPNCGEVSTQGRGADEVDWFGEIIDLGLDGKITVRLGLSRPVRDIRISSENCTLVYSSDMHDHLASALSHDGDSMEWSGEDAEEFQEMWVEYEGMDGQPIGDFNEEDWSTEDEDTDAEDATDQSMPDLEDIVDVEGERGTHSTKNSSQSGANGEGPQGTGPMVDNSQIGTNGSSSAELVPMEIDVGAAEPFSVLDTPPPSNHHYISTPPCSSSGFIKRMLKEHRILMSSLPAGILVRTWESRLDLLRVIMIGPSDTPYEYAPFIIDFHIPPAYPGKAPEAFFHSWTSGNGRVNPNLYEDGKICLSLLGTWDAHENSEEWCPSKSTLLQVLVSIHSLVLNKEPYYNEAGFDIHRDAPETKLDSAKYSERAYFLSRGFIVHALTHPAAAAPFSEELKYLYFDKKDGAPQLLAKAIAASQEIVQRSEADHTSERDGLRTISSGAVVRLKRELARLEEIAKQIT